MNNYDFISIIFFALGLLSFICFIVLAVKNNLVKLIADLLGITAKRTIKLMKSDSSKYSDPLSTPPKNVSNQYTILIRNR